MGEIFQMTFLFSDILNGKRRRRERKFDRENRLLGAFLASL